MFTLKSAQSASPVSYVASTQVMSDYALSFLYFSLDDMKRIASSGVAVARVKLGDGTRMTYEVKRRMSWKRHQKRPACWRIEPCSFPRASSDR